MSDLVGNPNCWFSHAQALLILEKLKLRDTHDESHITLREQAHVQ